MASVHPEAERAPQPQLRGMTRSQMEELGTLNAEFDHLRLAPYMCCSVLFKVVAATQGIGILCLPCIPFCAVSVLLDERLQVNSEKKAVLVNETTIQLDSITELTIDRGFAETCCCCVKRLTIKHTTGTGNAKTIELQHSRAVRDVEMVRDFILVKRDQQMNRNRERYRQRQTALDNRKELQRELTQLQYCQQIRDKADNIRMAEEITKLQAKIRYLEENKQINIPSENSDCDR